MMAHTIRRSAAAVAFVGLAGLSAASCSGNGDYTGANDLAAHIARCDSNGASTAKISKLDPQIAQIQDTHDRNVLYCTDNIVKKEIGTKEAKSLASQLVHFYNVDSALGVSVANQTMNVAVSTFYPVYVQCTTSAPYLPYVQREILAISNGVNSVKPLNAKNVQNILQVLGPVTDADIGVTNNLVNNVYSNIGGCGEYDSGASPSDWPKNKVPSMVSQLLRESTNHPVLATVAARYDANASHPSTILDQNKKLFSNLAR